MTLSAACATARWAKNAPSDIKNYIKKGKLWEAFTARRAPGSADR
jgi:hypothetical protein